MPDVTVLMAVYNGERHLRAAVDSVLSQTGCNFEFLIIDDGSTDRSREIIASYQDSRVRLVALGRNAGLSAALNEGLRLANAPLVARQDADDLSAPERLAKQLSVMNARLDLALLGSRGVAISEDGLPTGTVWRPIEPLSIRWFSVFDNPFIHTSAMFRTRVVRDLGGFNAAYDPFSQDYDLWCRVMEHHAIANLPDALVQYRVSDTSITGALNPGKQATEYERRFDRILRDLTARQARRVFGADTIADADATLIASLVFGIEPAAVQPFLALFERLLSRYRHQVPDQGSSDFRVTLARQFEALAFRVRPPSRASTAAIYAHVLRHHPDLVTSVSWLRAVSELVLGRAGRDRLARWKRRQHVMAKG